MAILSRGTHMRFLSSYFIQGNLTASVGIRGEVFLFPLIAELQQMMCRSFTVREGGANKVRGGRMGR